MFSLLREVDGWKEEGRMTERRRNRKEEKKETWLHVCVDVCSVRGVVQEINFPLISDMLK